MASERSRRFIVVNTVLQTGERLPTLVHQGSWKPCRLAVRWAVRYRRYHVQSSTLAHNLRVIAHIYEWAASTAGVGDLDDFICGGESLTSTLVNSLGTHLTARFSHQVLSVAVGVAQDFLTWSLDPGNRGGNGTTALRALSEESAYITRVLDRYRAPGRKSERITPLSTEELRAIRATMGLVDRGNGSWELPMDGRVPRRPRGVFREGSWLRNLTMLELALDTGLRRGEILKLKLASLPRGRDSELVVARSPDDRQDTRRHEPAVKSSERLVPMSRGMLQLLNLYVDGSPPMGRPRRSRTPYLFTSIQGAPLSISASDKIMQQVGKYAGVPLSWHALRHTWAERIAVLLKDDPRGWQKLKKLGGWADDSTAQRYIGDALGRDARDALAAYQGALYSPEPE